MQDGCRQASNQSYVKYNNDRWGGLQARNVSQCDHNIEAGKGDASTTDSSESSELNELQAHREAQHKTPKLLHMSVHRNLKRLQRSSISLRWLFDINWQHLQRLWAWVWQCPTCHLWASETAVNYFLNAKWMVSCSFQDLSDILAPSSLH